MYKLMQERVSFDIFKSNVCHRLKNIGDAEFIIELLENDYVRKYYKMKWYAESLYLLAMLDYLCKENDIPICRDYADLRRYKLVEPLFPLGINLADSITRSTTFSKSAIENSIPEFSRFNIIECNIRDVC